MHAARSGEPAVQDREASERRAYQTYLCLHRDKKSFWRTEESL